MAEISDINTCEKLAEKLKAVETLKSHGIDLSPDQLQNLKKTIPNYSDHEVQIDKAFDAVFTTGKKTAQEALADIIGGQKCSQMRVTSPSGESSPSENQKKEAIPEGRTRKQFVKQLKALEGLRKGKIKFSDEQRENLKKTIPNYKHYKSIIDRAFKEVYEDGKTAKEVIDKIFVDQKTATKPTAPSKGAEDEDGFVGEVEVALTGELSDAESSEEKGVSDSGFGVNLDGSVGYQSGKLRYQLTGNYKLQSNAESYGFGLRVNSSNLRRRNRSIFVPREGLGGAPRLLSPKVWDKSRKDLYDFAAFLQDYKNDHPGRNVPDQNVLFGALFAARLGDFLLGFVYRDSEVVYPYEGHKVTFPWRRLGAHLGFVVPLGGKHELSIGYQGALDHRGEVTVAAVDVKNIELLGLLELGTQLVLGRHGPFLKYEGKVNDVILGLSAYILFSHNALGEDYEEVWKVKPYVALPKEDLEIEAYIGNENPFIHQLKGGVGAKWAPTLIPDLLKMPIGLQVEYADVDKGIMRGLLTVGLRFGNTDETKIAKTDTDVRETPVPETEEKKGSREHLVGTAALRLGGGIFYSQFPLSRESGTSGKYRVPTNWQQLENECNCSREQLEVVINALRAERGPLRYTGGAPDIYAGQATLLFNVHTNESRTWQLRVPLDLTILNFLKRDALHVNLNTGLEITHPVKIGKGWAWPGSLAGLVGIDMQSLGADKQIWNWYLQLGLLQKVWGTDTIFSIDLLARLGGQLLPEVHRSPAEHLIYGLILLQLGLGDAPEEYKLREEPEVKIIKEKCPAPVVIKKPERFKTLEKQLHIAGGKVLFKNNEPKPVQDDQGFDKKIRDFKKAASAGYSYTKGTINSFIIQHKPGRFFDRKSVLNIPELAETVKEILKKNPDVKIILVGHTSSTGEENHNYTLSQNRAELVKACLTMFGVDASRLEVKAKGESELDYKEWDMPNGDYKKAAEAVNRRVIFKVESR